MKRSGSLEPGLSEVGLSVPSSNLARAARETLVTSAPEYLVNHSIRSYAWAVALADLDGRTFDPEILYVAAQFHDIGLLPTFDEGGCFEVDGGAAAERLALAAGIGAGRAAIISDAVVRHMAADYPASPPETLLLWESTGVDVSGYRFGELSPELVEAVVAAYPRLDFKREFSRAFEDQARRKPGCRAAIKVGEGMLERIASAPFAE